MGKQMSIMEWSVVEDDAEWEHLTNGLACVAPISRNRSFSKQLLWGMAVMFLFVASTDGWRYSAQAALHQSDAEVCAITAQELEAVAQDDSSLTSMSKDDSSAGAWWLRHAWEVRSKLN